MLNVVSMSAVNSLLSGTYIIMHTLKTLHFGIALSSIRTDFKLKQVFRQYLEESQIFLV